MALSNQDARNLDPAGATSDADEALMEQMRLAEEGLAEAPTAPAEPPRRRQRRDETPAAPEPPQQQAEGEEDAGESAPTEQQPRTVPLGHLQEERERRKAVETQLAEQRQQMRLLEERTNLLLQRQFAAPQPQQQAPPQPEPLPDFAQYPAEHIVAKLAQQERELAQFRQVEQQRQQQLAGAQQLQQLEQRARSFEMTFSAEHPDYGQAVNYIMNQRHQELNTLGIRDPGERQTKIQQEALGLAAMAIQNGMNPAEVLYNLATQRGYRAPAAIDAPTNGAANGHAEPPAAAPNAQQQQRLQQLADGQQQARSLSSARGQATPPPMTAERIAKMSDAQFLAWYDSGNADNRDIFGQ